MSRKPVLAMDAISVRLGAREVLSGIGLSIYPGEVVALLGPSGSGKTTLLGAVAGFVPITAGEIRIGDSVVATASHLVPPERRSVGFVFQTYALWPHLTALETAAFPFEVGGVERTEARRRAQSLLDSLGIGDLAGRHPAEMSGGQQQRVGLARALARDAALWLLDEPTAHLDAATRHAVEEIVRIRRVARGAAALYATHDPEEALGSADRVVLLRDGRVTQSGSPEEVYERPVDEWAARLTGSSSVLTRGAGRVVVRPEWVSLGAGEPATVVAVRFRGAHSDVLLETSYGPLQALVPGVAPQRAGDAVRWHTTKEWRLAE